MPPAANATWLPAQRPRVLPDPGIADRAVIDERFT